MNLTSNLIESCRAQFPALKRQENGQPVVFFDGPAGTQVPICVPEAMTNYLLGCNSNLHGQFGTSAESDELLIQCHQAHANFVNAGSGNEIAFGQNMTSLTFAFSRALAKTWNQGDEILVTALDHDANIAPWMLAAADAGVNVQFVDFRPDDLMLDMEDLQNKLNHRTRLVAVGCASNATGGINPIKRITEMAHSVDAHVFLDAVHYGPHGLIDVAEWDCDFLVCSNYKFFGPHLGMLWGRPELMEPLSPYKVRPASNNIPDKWMTGTQSHESIVGGMACIDYLAGIGKTISDNNKLNRRESLKIAFEAIVEYERVLSAKLIDGLSAIEGLQIIGIQDKAQITERFPTFSIRHEGIPSEQLARELGQQGIYVWNGNYYAFEFSTRMGFEPDGMVRIGLVHYNTMDEIERLIETLEAIVSREATQ
ncbi:MAG: cysteine desulfurase-like protein [Mariniblastus sp.]|nr:cysteine desulfurase-like protein [Mariniblastus sp.]